MKVSNSYPIYNSSLKPQSFKGNRRHVFDLSENGFRRLLYRSTTCFFREDIKWDAYVDMLARKYQNVDKVNVYCAACSAGEEPFSLVMALFKKLGKDGAKKFLPIIASDFDDFILKRPMAGIINPTEEDIMNIDKMLGDDFKKYVNIGNKKEFDPDLNAEVYTGKVSDEVRNSVIFSQGSIQKLIPNINPENSVVMCRNFWDYLPYDELSITIKKLFNQINESSLCVIGEHEQDCRLVPEFLEAGFSRSDVDFCLEKHVVEKPYHSFFHGHIFHFKNNTHEKKVS